MTWGESPLEAEVLDGRGRRSLSLGEEAADDFVIAGGARLRFDWTPQGLDVHFSTGVSGTASLKGDERVPLGQLAERGLVKEQAGGYALSLSGTDALRFLVGGQVIEVKQARGRISRLQFDLMAGLALVAVLALLAAWIAGTILPMEPLKLIPKTKLVPTPLRETEGD